MALRFEAPSRRQLVRFLARAGSVKLMGHGKGCKVSGHRGSHRGSMSEVRTFFRFCPACGKRFHIRLLGKKLVDKREEKTAVKVSIPSTTSLSGMQAYNPILVEQDMPVTIASEDFQYSYKCKHCGHVWSESRSETSSD